MSILTPFGGQEFNIPQVGDTGWGPTLTSYFEAIAQFTFQNPADFSNGTLALRQYIQTITPNAPTYLTIVPSGTSTAVALQLYSDSALANGSDLLIGTDGATVSYINSAAIGTGTAQPLDLQIHGTTFLRVAQSGDILINTLTDNGANLQVNGTLTCTSITAGTWTGGTIGIAYGGTGQTTANAALNALLPSQSGKNGYSLVSNGTNAGWTPTTGLGTVTSVGFADGSTTPIFNTTGGTNPVVSSGTLTNTLISQTPNTVFAGPASGSSAQPSFRYLVTADVSSIAVTSITGTSNEIHASASTGAVTLSFPQNVVIPPPSTGYALTVEGVASYPAMNIVGSSTSGSSYGLASYAGTTSGDLAFNFNTYGGTQILSSTGIGNVTVHAPSSGNTLTLNGNGTGYALLVNGLTNDPMCLFTDGTVSAQLYTDAALSAFFGTLSNHALNLTVNNTTAINIANTGAVTINAPSSGTALNVIGTCAATTFSGAGTNLTGTASSLVVGGVTVTNSSTNSDFNIPFFSGTTIYYDNDGTFTFNPSTDTLRAPIVTATTVNSTNYTGGVVTSVNGSTGAVTVPTLTDTPTFTTTSNASASFPSGFIMKFGSSPSTGTSPQSVTFTTAFPTSCLSVVITPFSTSAPEAFCISAISASGFSVISGSGLQFYWQAIGH